MISAIFWDEFQFYSMKIVPILIEIWSLPGAFKPKLMPLKTVGCEFKFTLLWNISNFPCHEHFSGYLPTELNFLFAHFVSTFGPMALKAYIFINIGGRRIFGFFCGSFWLWDEFFRVAAFTCHIILMNVPPQLQISLMWWTGCRGNVIVAMVKTK